MIFSSQKDSIFSKNLSEFLSGDLSIAESLKGRAAFMELLNFEQLKQGLYLNFYRFGTPEWES